MCVWLFWSVFGSFGVCWALLECVGLFWSVSRAVLRIHMALSPEFSP